jgi:hypothetical protein
MKVILCVPDEGYSERKRSRTGKVGEEEEENR